jgi:hypothetical protein
MSVRSDVLAVLNGKIPEKVPWLGDLDYWYKAILRDGDLPEKYQGDGIFQMHRDLGVGYYLQGYFPFKPVYNGVNVVETEGEKWRVVEVTTPIGKLRSLRKYSWDSHSWGFLEHLIKNWRDLEIFRYLYEHTTYISDYELANARFDLIGDNGLVVCYPPRTPFMQLVAMDAGIETVVDCIMEAPEEFDHTMEIMERKFDEATELVLDSPAEVIEMPENISSEIVGKRFFNKYLKNIYTRWNSKIKAKGKYSGIHFDGTLKGLIKDIASTGFNFLEAVTPAPVGNLSYDDLPNWVEEETILWGGIPGGYFSDIEKNDEEFDNFVICLLEIIRTNPQKFILGVSDQVVPGTRWERIKRVSELVEEFGRIDCLFN